MNIDLNVTLAIITIVISVIAFISPIAVAIINNKHSYKIKKLELLVNTKKKILCDFVSITMSLIEDSVSVNSFYSSLNEVLIYFENADYNKLNKIPKMIENKQSINEINDYLNGIIIELLDNTK